MKNSHWEVLLFIYQEEQTGHRPYLKFSRSKSLIRTCIKNNWIKEYADGTVGLTEEGLKASSEIAPLYKGN